MRFEAPLFWWAAAASGLGWIVWAGLLFKEGAHTSGPAVHNLGFGLSARRRRA
jgi:hypothetical protein